MADTDTVQCMTVRYPLAAPLKAQYTPLVEQVHRLAVDSAEGYVEAAGLLKRLNDALTSGRALFKPIKADADRLHATICQQEHFLLDDIEAAKRRLSQRMSVWQSEQEQLRQREQKRLQEEAQLAEAEQAEALGDSAGVEAALSGQGVVQVHAAPVVPKIEGLSPRETWSAEVTDLLALVKAVAAGQAPLAYVQANLTALNGAARAIKQELNATPGVRAVKTTTMVGRL